MAKITLLLGGVRSGKSDLAQQIASSYGNNVIYFVTARPVDDEMKQRIEKHRSSRPENWQTYEIEGPSIDRELLNRSFDGCYVLDCLTVYFANIMNGRSDDQIFKHVDNFIDKARNAEGHLVIVSNEVGMGVVPPYPDGRRYRDLLGKSNQMIAAAADDVYLLVAGIKTKIK